MRAITSKAVEAFYAHKNFKSGNTEVKSYLCDYNSEIRVSDMYLFGNLIARISHKTEHISDILWISHCGYKTNTTKERLNGLRGVKIKQIKGDWYLNGYKWHHTNYAMGIGVECPLPCIEE